MDKFKRSHIWIMIGLLYVSQGMPLGLAMEAFPVMLRSQGATLATLSLLPLVGLPWVIKFLWATYVDNHYVAAIGRRRSWIIPMQLIVCICFISIALTGVSDHSILLVLVISIIGSLASATQDIATDGLTAEQFSNKYLARANALQVGGTMIGFFIGGSGTLMLAGILGQTTALFVMASVVFVSALLVWGWSENVQVSSVHPTSASWRHFIRRPFSVRLLSMAVLSAMVAVAAYGFSKLILIDAGWSLQAVGTAGMLGGLVTVVLGCGGGSWIVGQFGARRVFIMAILISGSAICCWSYISTQGVYLSPVMVWTAIVLGCFGAGMASVAMMTMGMQFARQGGQAGTDMTALQSSRDLGEMLTSSSLTRLSASIGYSSSLSVGLLCVFLAVIIAVKTKQD